MYICIPCGHKQSACLFPCQYPDTTCLSISIWVATDSVGPWGLLISWQVRLTFSGLDEWCLHCLHLPSGPKKAKHHLVCGHNPSRSVHPSSFVAEFTHVHPENWRIALLTLLNSHLRFLGWTTRSYLQDHPTWYTWLATIIVIYITHVFSMDINGTTKRAHVLTRNLNHFQFAGVPPVSTQSLGHLGHTSRQVLYLLLMLQPTSRSAPTVAQKDNERSVSEIWCSPQASWDGRFDQKLGHPWTSRKCYKDFGRPAKKWIVK